MLRLLRFLWTGSWHEHKWEHVEKNKVYAEVDGKQSSMPRYFERVCKCEHCGTIKVFRT